MKAKWQKEQTLRGAVSLLVGIMGTIALSSTLSMQTDSARGMVAFGNSFTAFLLGVFASVLLFLIGQKTDTADRKGYIAAGIFSALLSAALTIGKQLETKDNWNVFRGGAG